MAPRPPKDDGKKAWDKVTQQSTPMDPEKQNRHWAELAAEPSKKPAKAAAKAKFTEKRTAPPSGSPIVVKPAPSGLSRAPREADKPPPLSQIEQKSRRRLGRGSMEIDARLDLHGFTANQAKAALTRFVEHGVAQRFTWVLVITGKGVRGEGVLKNSLPQWLSQPPLSNRVVAYDAATAPHGGDGAFYLRLRKPKTEQR